MLSISLKCRWCGATQLASATWKQIEDYKKGKKNIQKIFPNWTADQREMLISGTCGKCYKKMFEESEEMDEEDLPF